MKKTSKMTLCALMVALSATFMLTSYFPYLTYAIPAIAGLFIMVLVIELDFKWAFCAYLASAVIVFFIAEPEAKMLYIMFFGYYPLVKAFAEKTKSRVIEYVFKFLLFNTAVIITYFIMTALFDFSLSEFEDFGKLSAVILLAFANAVFVVYDIAVSKMAGFYIVRIHPSVAKYIKGR